MISLREAKQQWRERVTAAVALFRGRSDPKKIDKELKNLDEKLWSRLKRNNNVVRFAKTWGTGVLLTGSVASAPRSGRPRKVSKANALRAAAILKKGTPTNMVVTMEDGSQHMEETTEYFVSMKQAYSMSEDLQAICAQCRVTPEALLTAAMHADKDLTRRTLGFKHGHTPESLQARRAAARELDQLLQGCRQTYPHNKDVLLDHIVCVDEATIYLANLDAKSMHVFCSKQDISVHNVIQCPGLGKDKKIKVHFIAAVSLKHGPLYFNFTSGTRAGKSLFQGMARRDWVRESTDHPGLTSFHFPAEYKVRGSWDTCNVTSRHSCCFLLHIHKYAAWRHAQHACACACAHLAELSQQCQSIAALISCSI
jgi:hypothetical protein